MLLGNERVHELQKRSVVHVARGVKEYKNHWFMLLGQGTVQRLQNGSVVLIGV